MKLQTTLSIEKNYQAPQNDLWTGRATDPTIGKQYWHQFIEFTNIHDINDIHSMDHSNDENSPTIGLLGYACEEGVRRNLGRIGTKDAPNVVKQRLGKLSYHHANKRVVDLGNVFCDNDELEACQAALAKSVNHLLSNSIFPIVIGGGHDIAFGHFEGIWNAMNNGNSSHPKIGIINFDAHFDLRPFHHAPNSGTPFNQILSQYGEVVDYLVLGLQKASNTQSLFEIAQAHRVEYLFNDECTLYNMAAIKSRLDAFAERNDALYITIDIDGFSSAFAPGVSAPSPLGFYPPFVLETLKHLMHTKKVVSLDLAEYNPVYDQDNATANLVARLVDAVVGWL